MRSQFYMYCYPWDLEDEGIDVALGRIAGELGVDGITVAATSSDVRIVRGRPIGGRRTFTSPAAAHFQPDSELHRGNRIRPIAAAWMKSRNPLEKIAAAAERERLQLHLRIELCRGSALVERFPHAACVNAFGDSFTSHLCPSHPDVWAYCAAVARDLSLNYPASSLELDNFGFARCASDEGYSGTLFPDAKLRSRLLTWCFCSSCRQRASDCNVDAEAVRSALLKRWDEALAKGLECDAGEAHEDDPETKRFEGLRPMMVANLVEAICDATDKWLLVNVPLEPAMDGIDPAAISDFVDGFVVDGSVDDASFLAEAGIESVGGASKCRIQVMFHPPEARDGPQLVARVQKAVQAGFEGIGLLDYGRAPEPCFDWVRQAIRYARRESR